MQRRFFILNLSSASDPMKMLFIRADQETAHFPLENVDIKETVFEQESLLI